MNTEALRMSHGLLVSYPSRIHGVYMYGGMKASVRGLIQQHMLCSWRQQVCLHVSIVCSIIFVLVCLWVPLPSELLECACN